MKILLAEDDRSFRKGLSYELEELGAKVIEAEDGLEAINLIKDSQFDLIICDLMMPNIDGLDVYDHLRKSNLEAKFIMLTSFPESERADKSKKLLKENF